MFGILGRTSVRIEGEIQERWGTPKLRAVLATLLVYVGKPVSVDTLIDWAWSDEASIPRNPVSTFYTYVGRIRRVLAQMDGLLPFQNAPVGCTFTATGR
jgi:DNA-binding SARP family transcriptional activator